MPDETTPDDATPDQSVDPERRERDRRQADRQAGFREELGRFVAARRLSLGLSKDAAAASGDMSPVTWTRVEEGEEVRALTLYGIDRALDWKSGASIAYLEHNKPPEPAEPAPPVPVGVGVDPSLLAELSEVRPEEIEKIRDYVRLIKDARR